MKRLVFPPDLAAHTCTFVGRSTVGWVLHGLVPAQCLVSPTGLEAVCQGLNSSWCIPFNGFVEAA